MFVNKLLKNNPPKYKQTTKYSQTTFTDSKHTTIQMSGRIVPKIAADAFIAPSATLIGNIEVWDFASIWYNCVIKGNSTQKKKSPIELMK
jgi:hypothetical protein